MGCLTIRCSCCFSSSCCFAYRRNRQCSEVILVVNQVLHVLYDWRNIRFGFIFIGDIKHAFDHCPLASVAKSMQAAGVHCASIAAFIREQLSLVLVPIFEGLTVEPSPYEGILRQGGKEGLQCWDLLMQHVFEILHQG